MIIIPAIDIKGGKVVRLSQGKFHEVTIYSSDPVGIAKKWENAGASFIHVVDLDGAEQGSMQNYDVITQIAQAVEIPIQMGGGIRTTDDITKLIHNGVSRVVVGTQAVQNRDFIAEILKKWKGQIAVSLDCSRGIVAEQGWTTVSKLKATDLAKELEGLGLKHLIYTDIARDGMLTGPNINGIKEMLNATDISIIASGGIASLDDISKLAELEANGLAGVIVGKALYENRFYLRDAIDLCSQQEK